MTANAADSWVPDLTFPVRLAIVRNKLGWNAKEAALACGFPPQSWRNWETGRRPHDYIEVCRKIHERTGVDLGWLAGTHGGGMNGRYTGVSMGLTGVAA